ECWSFFQAEDGIRGRNVTGVQTCALPICARPLRRLGSAGDPRRRPGVSPGLRRAPVADLRGAARQAPRPDPGPSGRLRGLLPQRSEERRVGKECGSRGGPYVEALTTSYSV